ncbi:hypothetical protein B0J12DRAFT_68155 [Macrophomina phaseolina]|uniref:Uncharacterized protein n=1 Tax=Macrophomina phaseolina TaxID=35725 RepID=A0ABQ8GDG1_9PEZI|nr:hypothetical protein B0J12DRAFT_68155 [Macrophomina phaseolina]
MRQWPRTTHGPCPPPLALMLCDAMPATHTRRLSATCVGATRAWRTEKCPKHPHQQRYAEQTLIAPALQHLDSSASACACAGVYLGVCSKQEQKKKRKERMRHPSAKHQRFQQVFTRKRGRPCVLPPHPVLPCRASSEPSVPTPHLTNSYSLFSASATHHLSAPRETVPFRTASSMYLRCNSPDELTRDVSIAVVLCPAAWAPSRPRSPTLPLPAHCAPLDDARPLSLLVPRTPPVSSTAAPCATTC